MQPRRGSKLAWVGAVVCALVSLACFAYPLYVIWPFRRQGAAELHIALFLLRIGPWLAMICAAVCTAVVFYLWPRTRGWLRHSTAVLLVAAAVLGALLARFNLYEQMFHPIRGAEFEAADHAGIDASDKVLAIRINGVSRAYPVREIAYHHVVNDTVGGTPVAATY